MKRFLVVCAAAMLCCSLVHAQGAEDTGSGAGLNIIPRFDAGLLHTDGDDGGTDLTLGNTSLYTLFEGDISPHWSFSVANHWVASDWTMPGREFADALTTPTKDLYKFNGFGSGDATSNFLDWAYITYSKGPWEFSAGKQALLTGGFEFDEYDFDVNPLAASQLWNTLTIYVPAASVAWTTPSENHTFTLQWSTGIWNLAPSSLLLCWNGTFGPFSTKWSAMGFETPEDYDFIVSLGNRLELGDFDFTLDWTNATGDYNWYNPYIIDGLKSYTTVVTANYNPTDAFSFGLKYTGAHWSTDAPYGMSASGTPWLPENDTEIHVGSGSTLSLNAKWQALDWLEVHASAGYNSQSSDNYEFALLGITCNIPVKLW